MISHTHKDCKMGKKREENSLAYILKDELTLTVIPLACCQLVVMVLFLLCHLLAYYKPFVSHCPTTTATNAFSLASLFLLFRNILEAPYRAGQGA